MSRRKKEKNMTPLYSRESEREKKRDRQRNSFETKV
jgi:hypothetical protein